MNVPSAAVVGKGLFERFEWLFESRRFGLDIQMKDMVELLRFLPHCTGELSEGYLKVLSA
jgi:hypothetical protein